MSKNKIPGSLSFEPGWNSLLLICKECRRRKDGPRHLRAKTLASDMKTLLKKAAPQGRIVITTCLRLCPRNATAVAFVAAHSTPRIVAVESSDQLQYALPQLIEQSEWS